MKAPLTIFTGYDRLNYLCIVAGEMGLSSLAPMPTLLANFTSILASSQVGAHRHAIRNLRRLGVMPMSEKVLGRMVSEYHREHAASDPADPGYVPARFVINRDLSFEPGWKGPNPADVEEARQALYAPLPVATHSLVPADPSRKSMVEFSDARGRIQVSIGALGLPKFDNQQHDSDRLPRPIEPITWKEVLEQARAFDHVAKALGEEPRWESTFWRDGEPTAVLKAVGDHSRGLDTGQPLHLSGVKHLIGLPGAGKSTLIKLIAAILFRRGHKVAFFFPSVAVATDFVEDLGRYDVPAGLLFGQSSGSRVRHVARNADQLGRVAGGFGQSRPAAALFGNTCALGAARTDLDQPFPYSNPPCSEVYQTPEGGDTSRRHLCPIASSCGRNKAIRELAQHNIWASHISSTDAPAPPGYTPYRIHYLEHLARSFDLVVVDEVDNAVEMLDAAGSDAATVYGEEDSFATFLSKFNARISGGHNAALSSPSRLQDINDVGLLHQATHVATHVILNLETHVQRRLKDQLLTTTRLFAELFPPADDEDEAESETRYRIMSAAEMLWTGAAKRVVYGNSGDLTGDGEDDTLELIQWAEDLGCSESEVEAASLGLRAAMNDWVQARDPADRDETATTCQNILLSLARSGLHDARPHEFFHLVRLTCAVTFVVLRYLMVVQFLRKWVSSGEIAASSGLYISRPSDALMREMPESLLGRLAGMRYSLVEQGAGRPANLKFNYVSFVTSPRALIQRFASLYEDEGRPGPAVLATSATSFLSDSPTYHLPVGPHYLLSRPASGQGWARSEYRFTPLTDPQDPSRYLRFSGVPQARKSAALCAMAEQLFEDPPFGLAFQALKNDIKADEPRRVGLVVNSFAQCIELVEYLCRSRPDLASRIRGVVGDHPQAELRGHYVERGRVEQLSFDPDWHFLVFPPGAIGRGVNLVFPDGPRRHEAMLGSLFFLTRPHPTTDSLSFLRGLAGKLTADFDNASLDSAQSLDDLVQAHRSHRQAAHQQARILLSNPLIMANLGPLMRPFVADQMVPILQTIGRTMRNDCPAYIYFVDAAWANGYCRGERDTRKTSMLVMMHQILRDLLNDPCRAHAQIYQEIYQPFFRPLDQLVRSLTPEDQATEAHPDLYNSTDNIPPHPEGHPND